MIHNIMKLLLLFVVIPIFSVESRGLTESKEFIHGSNNLDEAIGTRWAVLIAGSAGYENYRHQADVCHAYQILKKGGLKDENIIVFMYDDIAFDENNPRPGVIINSPNGPDVYEGVPKDYTGKDVNVNNFFAVLLGNRTGLTGGSGKVVDSGPNDDIFVYYADHGGPGILGMPFEEETLYANDLNDVLKKKHALGAYKSLVLYIEACESGSIFEGLLPKGLNIYATTAANASESSYGSYCPGLFPGPPPEYGYTCLGDLYSVAWLEDSDLHDLRTETLKQQYQLVRRRTMAENVLFPGSNVMQYGDIELSMRNLFVYMGTNPENDNYTTPEVNSLPPSSSRRVNQRLDADVKPLLPSSLRPVSQRDANIFHFWHKFQNAPEGSLKKLKAQKQYLDAMAHREHIDNSMHLIGQHLFGSEKASEVMNYVRPAGQPLVDDWSCLKTMVKTFEMHCGFLSRYGMKYTRSLANICNAGVHMKMAKASAQACPNRGFRFHGFSA